MAIPTIFEESWPSPTKLGTDSRSAAILLGESRETIAGHLGIRTDELHFLGEPRLGFHLGITGLTDDSSTFFHSAVDREPAFAVARYLESQNLAKISQLSVDSNGIIQDFESAKNDVVSWQLINGETGVIQRELTNSPSRIFYDATSSGSRITPPSHWSTALWESRAWAGPAGLGIFGLRTGATWRNPLPHNDGKVVPGSASLALIVASALAIDSWVADEKLLAQRIQDINLRMRGFISERITGTSFATGFENTAPHLLSLIIEGVDEQQVLAKLLERGIHVDSGSACTATNMDTSHVLAAMKKSVKGNIRFTIHHEITEDEVDLALLALQAVVEEVREN